VKAIVLRINSGGGSALASEIIWREVALAKKKKPFIISFGDVAASGGYYIASPGDRIFAQPNTITGSIGVFGLIPNAQGLFADKLGITFDEVKITKHSVTNLGVKPLDEFESKVIQRNIDSTYETFLTRVATGRHQSFEDIENKAEGRVWSGVQAIKIGLVDQIGGLNDAINYAANKANIKDYKVSEYPKEKALIDRVLDGFNENQETKILEKEFGTQYKQVMQLKDLIQTRSIQARMPYIMEIE
jgi:protease-4